MSAVCSNCHHKLPANRIRFGTCAGCETVTSKRVTGQLTQAPSLEPTVIAPHVNRRAPGGENRKQTE